MMSIRAREGDFIETIEGMIFDVKGLVHPPDRIIAYLRYIPDPSGDRIREGTAYRKVYSLNEREDILRRYYPQYICFDPVFGMEMQGVPKKRILKVYRPQETLQALMEKSILNDLERSAVNLIRILYESSNVKIESMGISGSIMAGLHTEKSDIDVIVYGRKNCISVYSSLKSLMERPNGQILRYDMVDLRRLYEFRSKDTLMPYEDFVRIERRKHMQGKFMGRDFFVRFILDWSEVDEEYGDRAYSPIGYARIKATVTDDSEAIFTPCRYPIEDVIFLEGMKVPSLREIVSFRGRFCEQAKKGEAIIAQGKIEKVTERDGTEYFRMILGGKPSDFMISRSAH